MNDEKIIEELNKIRIELGHFPTRNELFSTGRRELSYTIIKCGGLNKFKGLLGAGAVRAPAGFWTKEQTIKKLNEVKKELGHFPKHKELEANMKNGLAGAIKKYGGINHFRRLLGEEILKVDTGFWTDDILCEKLNKIRAEIGHFPTYTELKGLGRLDLGGAITRNGGYNKFRGLLGVEIIQSPAGFWTKEKTIEKLKEIKSELGHFPTSAEIGASGIRGLREIMQKYGGTNKFRELLGEDIIKQSHGYWTKEKTIEKLKEIKSELGHFPTYTEIESSGQSSLGAALCKYGGSNYFRGLLGEEIIYVSQGYWTEKQTLKDLKKAIVEIGHFPTRTEIRASRQSSLGSAISKYGGIDYFRKMLGYPPSLESYVKMGAYVNIRGHKSEKAVKKLLVQYCIKKEIPEPKQNVKLSPRNIIEFVFEAGCGERIGIDVVNTQGGWQIRRKYLEKDYHKYLDKLWIVVLSDIFTDEDYIQFNEESPDNVEIMSVWDLIDTLQVDVDEHAKRKLEALETCTLRTKGDLINNLKNRTLTEFA